MFNLLESRVINERPTSNGKNNPPIFAFRARVGKKSEFGIFLICTIFPASLNDEVSNFVSPPSTPIEKCIGRDGKNFPIQAFE